MHPSLSLVGGLISLDPSKVSFVISVTEEKTKEYSEGVYPAQSHSLWVTELG